MLTIDDIRAERPEYKKVAAKYAELEADLANAGAAAAIAAVRRWDKLRRELET